MTRTVCILEKNALTREGLKTLLSEEDYRIIGDFGDIKEIPVHLSDKSCTLFIIGETANTDKPDHLIKNVKNLFPQSYVAVLGNCARTETICAAFAAGTDGYLVNGLSSCALKTSLQLITLGEKVIPTAFVSELTRRNKVEPGELATSAPVKFSKREKEIISKLTSGLSNKMIANELEITEATVKVHVKKILRQLGVANRTQVAIWALNNGFGEKDDPVALTINS